MKYKLIAFDYDGTLADTFEFHKQSIGDILRSCGSNATDVDMERLVGKTLKYILDNTLEEAKHELALEKLECFYTNIPESYWHQMKLFSDTQETLRQLKEKVEIALITNSHELLIKSSLKYFNILHYFDFVETADKDVYDKKTRIINLINKSHIEREEILYVGDTSGDIRDAYSTGVDSCLILNENSWINREEININQVKPNYIVHSVSGLLDL